MFLRIFTREEIMWSTYSTVRGTHRAGADPRNFQEHPGTPEGFGIRPR